MTSSLREQILPDEPARWALLAAAATTVGVAAGFGVAGIAVGVVVAATWLFGPARTAAAVAGVFVALGMLSGAMADRRTAATTRAAVPPGVHQVTMRIVEDTSTNRYGVAVGEPTAIDGASWRGPRIAVVGVDDSIDVGAVLDARGSLRPGVRRVRDEVVAGTFTVASVERLTPGGNPVFVVGNALRARVASTFGGRSATDGLLSGLLIGDTRRLGAVDLENLRRSGLAHFVAVSGSNVAVFMVAWWIVTAPLSMHPRMRVLVGAVGLSVFVVVTRWEPSVVRASVMAAVPLLGATVGIPVDPWMALGVAVTTLLLVSADLLWSVGFQLSVAATAGVLVGVAVSRSMRRRWLWGPLLVTVCAQVAVAPIILVTFGTVPLLAPVANLVVAPIVTAATVAGGLALVVGPLAPVASTLAGVVLGVARVASNGPQLGIAGVVATVSLGAVVAARGTRPIGVAVGLAVAVAAASQPSPWPAAPTLVALDVGQGDAILLQDPGGAAMLIDGGADPGTLDRALRRNGVSRIDVVVATHPDVDHVGGLSEVVASYDVGEVWMGRYVAEPGALGAVLEAAAGTATPVREVGAGTRALVGRISIEVLGPRRRYASDNDGSVVILATAGRSVLIPGDVEGIAQRELPPLRPDVLIVPHHGSSSTDPTWLARTVGSVAVLSYGVNRYGHPAPDTVAVLEESSVEILDTFEMGDVRVDLSS